MIDHITFSPDPRPYANPNDLIVDLDADEPISDIDHGTVALAMISNAKITKPL